MIKTMIVEDEPPILRAISNCIEKDPRFIVTATAMTGQKALEQLRKTPVEVVFTDIRMPVMDGLALAAHLREEFPNILTVIISGYQEFDYLQTAIRQQVQDYLLKPVTPASLAPVLERLAGRVEKGRGADFRRSVENVLFHEEGSPPQGNFFLGLFCAGAFPLVDDLLLPGRGFWEQIDVASIWEQLTAGRGLYFGGRTFAETVFVAGVCGEKDPRKQFVPLWETLNAINLMPVTAAICHYPIPGKELGEFHKNLRHTLHTSTRLFTPNLLEAPAETTSFHPDTLRKELDRALRQRDSDALRQSLIVLVEHFTEAGATELQLLHFLEAVLVGHLDPLEANAATLKLELRATVSNAQTSTALAEDITYLFASLFEEEDSQKQEREPALIRQIEQYLQENYDKTITTSVLSERFGFVPSYLSKLFRLYRGVSPSEYLTICRVEHAKTLIDANPEILMKEVASTAGFRDQYYFSKIFKKEMGILPTEYAGKLRK